MPTVISRDDVKARLNKTLNVDDAEIDTMIDAAEAEYAEYVGPLPGTITETFSGGGSSLLLRSQFATAVTAASYSSGATLDYTTLQLDPVTGIVYAPAGSSFTPGVRNVSITYTVTGLPANHRETIIADVAGYFEASQRSDSSNRGAFPGAEFDEAPFRGMPMVLFPRIRALALPRVG